MLPTDLVYIQTQVFDACGFKYTEPIPEIESAEYNAYYFKLNKLNVRFRKAKTTPTKVGQFVTLWKRLSTGPIAPFDETDSINLVIINVVNGNQLGQFIFPKSVLCEQGILTVNHKEGKRGFRVYSPWDKTTSKQAIKTQKWQLNYFLDLSNIQSETLKKAKSLYNK
ncbi:MAG: MepB family protein [Bacteroidia bacterium]|nr:MepB family protein [Bacteroidia bacterium]